MLAMPGSLPFKLWPKAVPRTVLCTNGTGGQERGAGEPQSPRALKMGVLIRTALKGYLLFLDTEAQCDRFSRTGPEATVARKKGE